MTTVNPAFLMLLYYACGLFVMLLMFSVVIPQRLLQCN